MYFFFQKVIKHLSKNITSETFALYSLAFPILYIQFSEQQIFYSIVTVIALVWILFAVVLKIVVKKRTAQLQKSERQLSQVAENMLDMVCQTDMEGKIIYVSPSFGKTLGYENDELIGTSVFEFLHPDDVDRIRKVYSGAFENNLPERIEFRYKTSTERYIWIEASGSLIFNEKDKIIGAVFGSRDITGRKLAEELLWKQAQLQKNLLSAVPALVYLKDTDFRYIEVNERMAELLGVERNFIIGKTDYDLFPEDMADIYYTTDVEVTTKLQAKHNIQALYHTQDGKHIWLSTSKMPYYNPQGEMIGLAGVSIDITDELYSEEKLHITQFAIDKASQAVIMLDPHGNIIYMNEAAEKILKDGQSEEVAIRKIGDFFDDLKDQNWYNYWNYLKINKLNTTTHTIENSEKVKKTYETLANYLEYKGNEYCITYNSDITERKEAEAKILSSESRYRTIVENIYDVVWILDLDLNTTFITPSIERLTGFTVQEHIDQKIEDKFTPGSITLIKRWYEYYIPRLINNELDKHTFVLKGELEYYKKEGGTVWTEMTIKLLTDANDTLIGIHGTSVNIDSRKRAEIDLRKSKEKYKSIYENIRDVYYEALIDSTLIEISPSFEKLSKYTCNEVLGTSIYKYYKEPRQRDAFINEIMKKGVVSDFEIALVDKDGRIIDCSITASLLKDENDKPLKVCGTIRDISERKTSEIELKESEKRYKSLVHLSPNPILVIKDKYYAYANPAAITFFGCKEESEIIGKSPLDSIFPDDVDLVKDSVKDLKEYEANRPIEHRILKKNGEIVNAITTSILITYEGAPAILVVTQDITKIKEYENELIHSKTKAEESDKLKSAFLANMSHEIRTPLNGIIGFAGLLRKPNLKQEKLNHYANIINSSSHQLLAIINDIIDISKIEAGQMTLNNDIVSIHRLAEEVSNMFKSLAAKKGVELILRSEIETKKAEIIIDEVKLKQILNNLLNNSLKFTDEGKIEIKYEQRGNFILFTVKDTGIGIPEMFHKIVFERFRQVELADNRQYGGTGLGLSISKALVEMLGGSIWLDSQPGVGTTFYFTIPFIHVPRKNKTKVIETKEEDHFDWSGKTILVAEDESTNYLFIEEIIIETGAQILHADNGVKAIEIYKNHKEINLVILDIKMPEIDGYEVIKQIKMINQEIPVVAQTAYAMSNDRNIALSSGFIDYIAKPIERIEFLRLINKYIK